MAYGPDGSNDPASQLSRYLRPGERLLWSGRPDPAVRFTPADAFLVPFSIMWGGFALFWEGSVLGEGGPPFFVLWGIPFVAMGLYFIFGRFVYKRRTKLRTAYGVTTERAMVAVGESSLAEMPIKHVATSQHRTREGRHVSVMFGDAWRPWERAYSNTGMEFFTRGATPVAFYDVPEPDALLAAIERARAGEPP